MPAAAVVEVGATIATVDAVDQATRQVTMR